ncbi:hypothetical protein CCACVL1_13629 [Corchorus capsularis]|uniref:Uncharacterized protein n=1 Tax=Corchorus capsularis TaxID=210143 RepID=A0A1R3IA77_COCAP|nr:hypothetical protein CCACVL1_13629 [Corchorus capsularis]
MASLRIEVTTVRFRFRGMGGRMVVEYKGLTLVTVRGAGHLVPLIELNFYNVWAYNQAFNFLDLLFFNFVILR